MKILTPLILTLYLLIFTISPASGTTIQFWTSETQSDRMKTIQLLMDLFQALNPDITIVLVPVDENDIPSQLAAASAADNLPGLIEASSELMMAFGEEGILDTDRATKIIDLIGRDRFYQGGLKMVGTPDPGKYYAIPFHGWVQGIWYRVDWFKKAGLEPPNTWANILKAAKILHKPSENQYGILVGTGTDFYSEQCFTHFALSNGAGEFNENGELIFNSKKILHTLEYYAELARYNPPGPQTWRARDYYLQGRMAMFFYSTYIMDDLALAESAADSLKDRNFPELKGAIFDPQLVDNTGVTTTITGTQPAGYGVIVALGIVNHIPLEQKEAAQRLAAFMYEPSSYITFIHMSPGGMSPVLNDISSMPEYLNDPNGIFKRYGKEKVKKIITGLDNIESFATFNGKTFPDAGKIYAKKIIPRMIYSVTIEGTKPEDAIALAERQMREVMGEKD